MMFTSKINSDALALVLKDIPQVLPQSTTYSMIVTHTVMFDVQSSLSDLQMLVYQLTHNSVAIRSSHGNFILGFI